MSPADKFYLGKDKRSLLQHIGNLKAAQSSNQEGVVGLWPVAAHHLHCDSSSADPTEKRQWESELVKDPATISTVSRDFATQ